MMYLGYAISTFKYSGWYMKDHLSAGTIGDPRVLQCILARYRVIILTTYRGITRYHTYANFNPKVHSPPFATTVVAAALSTALPGRPGLATIGFNCIKLKKLFHKDFSSLFKQTAATVYACITCNLFLREV